MQKKKKQSSNFLLSLSLFFAVASIVVVVKTRFRHPSSPSLATLPLDARSLLSREGSKATLTDNNGPRHARGEDDRNEISKRVAAAGEMLFSRRSSERRAMALGHRLTFFLLSLSLPIQQLGSRPTPPEPQEDRVVRALLRGRRRPLWKLRGGRAFDAAAAFKA